MAGYVLNRPSALLRLLSANSNNNNGAATILHDRFNVQVNYKNSRQPQNVTSFRVIAEIMSNIDTIFRNTYTNVFALTIS